MGATHQTLRSMPTFSCLSCSSPFERSKPSKYCSRPCFFAARRTGQTVSCAGCRKSFYREAGHIARGAGDAYCSAACHNAVQAATKVRLSCKTCGSAFFVSPSSVVRGRRYCSLLCRDACPDFKRDCWIENNLQLQKKAPTRLEIAGRALLSSVGIEFVEQVLIADRFTVDALIPALRIVVQWDGDYWHGWRPANDNTPLSPRQARRAALDVSQDAYMRKAGYTVLRFWEHEVKNTPEHVRSTIIAACKIAA